MWAFAITWRPSSVNFSHFNLSSLKPLSQMNWNLVGSIYGRSSIKNAHFSSRSINKHGHHRQFLFLIGQFKKIFSPIKIAHFVPIHLQTWPPQTTLVSDWLIFKILLLWNVWPNGREHLWVVLSRECTFCLDPLTNMAATSNSCFWLVDFQKFSPLKPLGQMNQNLVGSIYGRSSINIAHFVPIGQQTWLPQAVLVSE